MAEEIRHIKESELDEFVSMSEYAFQHKLSTEEKEERKKQIELKETLAYFIDGAMASKLIILPLKIYMNGKVLEMGGLSSVATWPEYRRKGLVKCLLKESLKMMYDNNQVVSMLHPFSVPFYRKYGWELSHRYIQYEIKREQLPNPNAKGEIKRMDMPIEEIQEVYEQYAEHFAGSLKRTKKWWEQRIFTKSEYETVIFENRNEVTGYMIYKVKNNKFAVEEIVYLDDNARRGLWRFIKNHDSMIEMVKLYLPNDTETDFWFPEPRVKQEVIPYFMGRIVDVKSFLEQYPFQKGTLEQPLFLHITDSFAEWNTAIYMLKEKEGQIMVSKHEPKQGAQCTHPPKRGLMMSINTLSTLFFQYIDPLTLYQLGYIEGELSECKQLATIIPKQDPYLLDFF